MKTRSLIALAASLSAFCAFPLCAGETGLIDNHAQVEVVNNNPQTPAIDRAKMDEVLAQWPARPRLAALTMIARHGVPQEITSERAVWHDAGPFKRITVTREENRHDFPQPHTDFIEHTVVYNLPLEKLEPVSAFDGSVTFNRTKGELSARCDSENHNILSLNLAHDIVAGKTDPEGARQEFTRSILDEEAGRHPKYMDALQFRPTVNMGRLFDAPTIPGSPQHVSRGIVSQHDNGRLSNAEILAVVAALDENQILAAAEAEKKEIDPQVLGYARMLHAEHGRNLDQTRKLGQKIRITPLETAAVEDVRVKGAGNLALLVPLDGDPFVNAFLNSAIQSHTEAINRIDNELVKDAGSSLLKQHLADTRDQIVAQRERAQRLLQTQQAQAGRTTPDTVLQSSR